MATPTLTDGSVQTGHMPSLTGHVPSQISVLDVRTIQPRGFSYSLSTQQNL